MSGRDQPGDRGLGAAPRPPGWTVPLEVVDGRLPRERPDRIADTARLILEVVPGERRLLPEFGCRIHRLERIQDEGSRHVAAALVEEALDRWAPQLGVDRAEVVPLEDSMLEVSIRAGGAWTRFRIAHRPPPVGES